jgi:hypothetical protein
VSANGRLASSELLRVQTGRWAGREADIYLATGTGNAYLAMAAACRKEAGRSLEIAEPMGGYRPFSDQAQMRADWYAHNWTPYNLDPHSTVPPAPAGTSNHGFGICADIWGTGYQWAIQNAHRWGFSRPFPETDPHHFQHDGRTATSSTSSEPLDNTTPAPIRRNTVSTIYYWTTTDKPSTSASPQKIGGFALAGDGQGEAAWLPINAAVYEEMTPVHGQGVFLSKQSFDAFQKMYTAGASAPVTGTVDLGPLLARLDALTAAVLAPETTTKTTA